jgi:hypothetical protein
VVLFSAGQPGDVPSGSDVVGPMPWMMLAATWAAPSSRGLPAQAGADPDPAAAEAEAGYGRDRSQQANASHDHPFLVTCGHPSA